MTLLAERKANNLATMPAWIWALLPMLLAAALVLPVLGRDILGGDESATMRIACARWLGPCSPAEAIANIAVLSPDQTWGLAIVFSQWGQLVGWSEFAVRALSWIVGPLTLAWVYRLGRDLFTPPVALAATLLTSTSVLFLVNMYMVRLFGPVMLFSAIALWGYWRVTLAARRPIRGGETALLAGATGLLYSHYYSALLIPALGLFHLLFAHRKRRWWRATILLALAALVALPQAPDLLGGIAFTEVKDDLHRQALDAGEVLVLFFRYLSGDLVRIPAPVAGLLVAAIALLPPWALWRIRRHRWRPDAGACVALAATLLVLLFLAVNARFRVLAPERVRYLASLWPPAMLLLGVAFHLLWRHSRRALALAPVALLAFAGAADFLWEGDLRRLNWRRRLDRATIAVTHRVAAAAGPDSLLLIDPVTFGAINHSYELYTGMWGSRRVPLYRDSSLTDLLARARDYREVWLLYLTASEASLQIPEIVDELTQGGWAGLLDWQDGRVTLRNWRAPPPRGPQGSPARATLPEPALQE